MVPVTNAADVSLNGNESLLSSEFQILLVDDSNADASIFEVALAEASTRVKLYWVASGEEALEFVHAKGRFEGILPPKIMVLDLNMPGATGFEVLKAVRADARTRHLPVVVFSTSSAQKDVNMAYALGANAYFAKPMSLEMYISKVRIIIQHWLDLALLPSPEVGQPE
jgi:two-component system response regulator